MLTGDHHIYDKDTLTLVINKTSSIVLYFETLQKAENYIEPDDAPFHNVYSAQGKVVDVVVKKRWPLLWRFKLNRVVELQQSEQLDDKPLKEALLKHLSNIGHNQNLSEASPLDSLIQTLTEVQPHGRITVAMQQILNDAQELFKHYTRGAMSNNCDPECCPNDETNIALQLPIQEIPDEHLWLYYTGGPCRKGEMDDFKYFLPTLAQRVAEEPSYWEPFWLSDHIYVDHAEEYLDEWTNEERLWLARFFEELGKSEKYKKVCDKTVASLLTEEERAGRN